MIDCFRLWQVGTIVVRIRRAARRNRGVSRDDESKRMEVKMQDMIKNNPGNQVLQNLTNLGSGIFSAADNASKERRAEELDKYSGGARLLMFRCLSAWKQANAQAHANERFVDVEDESNRLVRLVEAAALRYDDIRLVRQVFREWVHRLHKNDM